MIAYADSGFLLALYLEEVYSPLALAVIEARPLLWLTPLHIAEVANALALRLFRRQSPAKTIAEAANAFAQDRTAGVYREQTWNAALWDQAANLSRQYSVRLGTRTLDVLHVAAAMAVQPEFFLSFDRRQRSLANAAGLPVLPRRLPRNSA